MMRALSLRWTVAAGCLGLLLGCSTGDDADTTTDSSDSISALLQDMTLEQKVGQMLQGEIKHVTPEDVRQYGLGSVLNGGGSFPDGNKLASLDDWTTLADAYYAASIDTSAGSMGIPIIWGTDAVHGHNNVIGATLFPHNIGLGASNDPELVGRIAQATAREVKATGIDWLFAPTIAVANDPRWGRTYESFSSDPERVASFAAPIVNAVQGEGLAATAKHFIGDGGTYRGVDQGDTRLPLEELLAQHGLGYYEAIEAGALSVMASFSSWNGEKLHGNRTLLTDVLKDRLGFEGFVVSDWNGIGQVAGCTNTDCAQAINAGIDMVMAPDGWKELHATIVRQVQTGVIPLSRIDDAVRRILTVKAAIGLLDRQPPSKEAASYKDSVGSAAHRAIAREAVRKSLVLLKNNAGLVPLDPSGTYVVTGPGANDIGMQSGGWTISWQGTGNTNSDFPGATSVLDGLKEQIEAAGGQVVTTLDDKGEVAVDGVIYVFGETPYAEGVGDIESLAWQQQSQQDTHQMKSWHAEGVPVVGVFITGRPRWINAELNAADAMVVAWLPGSEGAGVADVLLQGADGSVQHDFLGRLPMPWPAADLNSDDPDQPVSNVLFPVGYGLHAGQTSELSDLDETPVGQLVTGTEVLFDGGVRAPWILYLGDDKDPALAAGPANAESAAGGLAVTVTDRRIQEDTRRFDWLAEGARTRTYFGRGQPWDASGLLAEGGHIALDWRYIAGDISKLEFIVSCGKDCETVFAIAPFVSLEEPEMWSQYRLPLRCLVEAGVDVANLESPVGLVAEGPLTIEVSGVSITDGSSGTPANQCPEVVNYGN